jgi:hypothetical protein
MIIIKKFIGHFIDLIKHVIGKKNPCKSLKIPVQKWKKFD